MKRELDKEEKRDEGRRERDAEGNGDKGEVKREKVKREINRKRCREKPITPHLYSHWNEFKARTNIYQLLFSIPCYIYL